MQTFATSRDAKEFLISRIITESQIEGVPLSDVERKMLYFSETGWTLPDIEEVNDAFDHDYDQVQYEQKIGTLIRNFCTRARKDSPGELETWNRAVETIRHEDHYLLVLIDTSKNSQGISGKRILKLSAIVFTILCVISVIAYLFSYR